MLEIDASATKGPNVDSVDEVPKSSLVHDIENNLTVLVKKRVSAKVWYCMKLDSSLSIKK